MAVTCPNIEDAPSYDAMAVRDSADYFALSCDAQGTGVVSGMAVTGASVMGVNIATGTVSIAGTTYGYAGGSVAVGAASTSDRRDSVVYIAGTGASVVAGTPCGYTSANWNQNVTTNNPPVKPTMPANSVLLAEVYVAGSGGTATTAIYTATNLVDKRLIAGSNSTYTSTVVGAPSGQSYLASGQLTSGAPPNTRRAMMAFASGAAGYTTTYQDLCTRVGFTMPMNVTRCRVHIRNADVTLNVFDTSPIAITGIWWGSPTLTETAWLGDFSGAPTQVWTGAAAADIGTTEVVSPWFTPPTSAIANAFQGISIGATAAADNHILTDDVPGWTWHGASVAGFSATAGASVVPSGTGTASTYTVPFDLRIEYEFVGSNQIGVFFGDSLTAGYINPTPTAALGSMGSDNSWPQKAAKRLGHAAINGGVAGGVASTFTSTSAQAWSRFDLGTLVNSGVSCTPDYGVICLGVNDSVSPIPLSIYQTNYMTIINNLQAAGMKRIFACTVPIGSTTVSGSPSTCAAGTLNALLGIGGITGGASVSLTGPVNNTTKQGGPARGQPGSLSDWYNVSNVITMTSNCSGTNGQFTIATSGNFVTAGVTVGMIVTPIASKVGSGAMITAVSTGSITVMGANAGTFSSTTITISPYSAWIGLPGSTISEGPFSITGVTGTTTLTLTINGTNTDQHAMGEPVFATGEGLRQAYNSWIRSGIPGVTAVIDLDYISCAGGMGAVGAGNTALLAPQVPISQGRWDFYGNGATAPPHPSSPGMYEAFAALFASSGIGA